MFLSGHVSRMPRNVPVKGAENCRVQTAGAKHHPGGKEGQRGRSVPAGWRPGGDRAAAAGGGWGARGEDREAQWEELGLYSHASSERRGELLP